MQKDIKSYTNFLVKLNKLVSFFIFAVSLYLIGLGLAPDIVFALNRSNQVAFNQTLLDSKAENQLMIPKILVLDEIHEGDKSQLNKGIWRIPHSQSPDAGNIVLVAHRFFFLTGTKTFYHLDKLEIGDDIFVKWDGVDYNYKVSEIKEVDPSETQIEDNTDKQIITLYTCTPLWTADKRLVVIGKLV